jgi:hypothetical protein
MKDEKMKAGKDEKMKIREREKEKGNAQLS